MNNALKGRKLYHFRHGNKKTCPLCTCSLLSETRYFCTHCGLKHQTFCQLLNPVSEDSTLAELAKRVCLECNEPSNDEQGDERENKRKKRSTPELLAPQAPGGVMAMSRCGVLVFGFPVLFQGVNMRSDGINRQRAVLWIW